MKEIIKTLIGWQEEVRIKIEPYEGYESALVQSELEKARIERVKKVLSALSAFSSRISKERKKGNPYSYLVATEEKHLFKVNMLHFLDSPLSIVHNILGSEFTNAFEDYFYCKNLCRFLTSVFCRDLFMPTEAQEHCQLGGPPLFICSHGILYHNWHGVCIISCDQRSIMGMEDLDNLFARSLDEDRRYLLHHSFLSATKQG